MNEKQALESSIISLASGNNEALSYIYDNLGRLIYSVALGITERTQDAEDVLQETMIEVVKYAHSYKIGTNPRAWVLAIARHNALDIIRRRKEQISLDDASVSDIEYSSSLTELAPDVSAPLAKLDDDEKQVILLRIYAELPFSKVAEIMEISVFAAQKRYQRAIKKLKRITEVL